MLSDIHYLLTLVCCAGMLTEIFLRIRNIQRDEFRIVALPVVWALGYVFALISFDKNDYAARLLAPCVVVGFTAAFLFAGELLPAITKYHVLSFTIIFWYLFAAVYLVPPSAGMDPRFAAFCAACSAVTVLGLFLRGGAQAFIRPVSYIWYILVTAVAGWTLFSGRALDFAAAIPAAKLPGPFLVFVTGMALMYLVILFIDLFFIAELSVSGNRDRLGRKSDPRKVFRLKFLDIPLQEPNRFTLILAVQFVLTCVNYRLKLLSPFFFANLCLLAMPRLVTSQLTSDPDALPEEPLF